MTAAKTNPHVVRDDDDEDDDAPRAGRKSTMAVEVIEISVVNTSDPSNAPNPLGRYRFPIAGGNLQRRRQLAQALRAAALRHGVGEHGEITYTVTRVQLEEV